MKVQHVRQTLQLIAPMAVELTADVQIFREPYAKGDVVTIEKNAALNLIRKGKAKQAAGDAVSLNQYVHVKEDGTPVKDKKADASIQAEPQVDVGHRTVDAPGAQEPANTTTKKG